MYLAFSAECYRFPDYSPTDHMLFSVTKIFDNGISNQSCTQLLYRANSWDKPYRYFFDLCHFSSTWRLLDFVIRAYISGQYRDVFYSYTFFHVTTHEQMISRLFEWCDRSLNASLTHFMPITNFVKNLIISPFSRIIEWVM